MCLKNGFRPRENLNTDERRRWNSNSSIRLMNYPKKISDDDLDPIININRKNYCK